MATGTEPASDPPDEPLTALERALRRALATATPEQVLRRVKAVFPTAPVEVDTSRFHGKVRKVSVSMPEELTAAVRERSGPGGFSRYVTDAVGTRLRHELLGDLLDELDAEYGPVPEELIQEAMREWPDYEEE